MKKLQLTQGKEALVDDEDYDFLSQWKWSAHNTGCGFYVVRREGDKSIYMHRVLLLGEIIDHKDGNGLNNQKENLRPCTHSQNVANRKPRPGRYLGITFRKDTKKWRAQIQKSGVYKNIGSYNTEKEAAEAYNQAAKSLHGEFANLNILS